MPAKTRDDDLDLDNRALCPDGACIGVIGDDGLCGECGRAAGAAPFRSTAAGANADQDDGDDEDHDGDDDEAADGDDRADDAPRAAAPTAWDDRALCPDGACIGVLGDDGRCRECGTTSK